MLASRPAVLIPGCVGFQAKAFVPQASTPKFQLDWHRLACTLSAPESCPRTVSEPPICRCSLGGLVAVAHGELVGARELEVAEALLS